MSTDDTKNTNPLPKDPLLRKIAQLGIDATRELEGSRLSSAPKLGIDYLRDHIVEETRKRHPLATREEILEDMDAMGF
jgi:hypothetical protein